MKYQDEYNDFLDELYDTGIWNFSKLLEDSDPIAYNVGYDDFLDSRNLNEDDEDDEDDEENTESENQ
tara:strand:+ start:428 stop:628 length:201 start_codon:yes stop_codon:yes gene_type:complete